MYYFLCIYFSGDNDISKSCLLIDLYDLLILLKALRCICFKCSVVLFAYNEDFSRIKSYRFLPKINNYRQIITKC